VTAADARALTDHVLAEDLRAAVLAGDQDASATLRAEARRRFAGMLGLPGRLMGEEEAEQFDDAGYFAWLDAAVRARGTR
jgi:hypothetical protein